MKRKHLFTLVTQISEICKNFSYFRYRIIKRGHILVPGMAENGKIFNDKKQNFFLINFHQQNAWLAKIYYEKKLYLKQLEVSKILFYFYEFYFIVYFTWKILKIFQQDEWTSMLKTREVDKYANVDAYSKIILEQKNLNFKSKKTWNNLAITWFHWGNGI